MNCPHCQNELPENYGAAWCPFCGRDLQLENSKTLQELPAVKFNWRLFLCALLFPALATLLSAAAVRLLMSKPMNEGVSPLVGLIGGTIGGVICGVMLGVQCSKNLPVRILLSILMSAVMIIICIMLCLFGCGIGCFINGCCLGRVCEPSWFTLNDVNGVARWPSVPVEFLFNALMLGVILLFRWGRIAPGQLFHIYLMAYGVFRFFHEFMRDTPQILGPISGYQIASLAVALLGLAGFLNRRRPVQRLATAN